MKRIGVVVPTLFTRGDYLRQALESIRTAGDAFVILMGPDVHNNAESYKGLYDQLIEEPLSGPLSSKLTLALNSFPKHVCLITWLGDDDMLTPGSLDTLRAVFNDNEDVVLAYGACEYIDSLGNRIWQNKSAKWAINLSRIGPFLAPQPGSLFRRRTFESIGELDPQLELAFDFDLFLALSNQGKVQYVNRTLARFRWHGDSLSVRHRRISVKEASLVRMKHASLTKSFILRLTNPLVERATLLSGWVLNLRLRLQAKKYL